MTVLFTFAVLASVGVKASFQFCAEAGAFQTSMIAEYTCTSVTQAKCVGEDLKWDEGACKATRSASVHTKNDGTELASLCAAANGTASSPMTCGAFQSFAMANAVGPDKAFCLAKNAKVTSLTNKQLMQYLQAMGCCGTAAARTQCDVVAKPDFQVCANDADWQPGVMNQITCTGLTKETCKGLVQGAEFKWEQSGQGYKCRVNAIQPQLDLYAACRSKNGAPSEPSTCANLPDFFFGNSKSDKAGCSAPPQQQSFLKTNAETADYIAATIGCCKGATPSNPKTTCAKFFPKMELCRAGTYRADRVIMADCSGVAQANCSGTGHGAKLEWSTSDSKCESKSNTVAETVDVKALCNSKNGTVSSATTCVALSNHVFKGKVSDPSGCSSASFMGSTVKWMSDFLAGAGCCQEGVADSCCADTSKCNIVAPTTGAPTTAVPSTAVQTGGVAPKTVVSLAVTLKNIDFDKIQANDAVKTKLVDSIKQGFLDKLIGYTKQALTVVLTRGSVVATVKITPKVGSDSTALMQTVQTERTNIAAAALTHVKAVSEVTQFLQAGKTLSDITATSTAPVAVAPDSSTTASGVSMAAVVSANVLALSGLLAL